MLFRGYTGQFPDGKRGWTALLLRRYPFAQMGIDDHDLLFAGGSTPAEEDLLGTWRLDALYYSNQPVQIAQVRFDRSASGQLQIDCDTSDQRTRRSCCRSSSPTISRPSICRRCRASCARSTATIWSASGRPTSSGAYAKFLLAGSPGLFHPEKGAGRARRFALYYLLTRIPG